MTLLIASVSIIIEKTITEESIFFTKNMMKYFCSHFNKEIDLY